MKVQHSGVVNGDGSNMTVEIEALSRDRVLTEPGMSIFGYLEE